MSNRSRHGVKVPDGFAFTCAGCGEVAATLGVLGAGERPGWATDGPSYRLDFLGENTGVAPAGLALLLTDVEHVDPLDLAEFPGDLGAFCCVACELNYCATCWSTWMEFDESFYDCTRGRCPQGHEQLLDD